MSQTWNNLLGFIKRRMGAKLNLLEMSDEELIEGIKEDVIPYFSQYSPAKKFVQLKPSDKVSHVAGYNQWRYRVPVPPGEQIIDIFDAYFSSGSSWGSDDPFEGTKSAGGAMHAGESLGAGGSFSTFGGSGDERFAGEGMIDIAIANSYGDIAAYLAARNTWQFFPPNIIEFDEEMGSAVVVYNTPHVKLETISPDFYETIFKKLVLGNVMMWISALRSKYEGLATPFGTVNVNWQKLESDGKEYEQQAQALLDAVPLDHFVHVSV